MVKNTLEIAGGIVVFIALVGLAIWWEWSIWSECRAFGHSWFYCFNLLGSK